MRIDELHEPLPEEKITGIDALKAGKTMGYEAWLKTRTGEKIPIQVMVRRVMVEEVEMIQWLMRNISERKDLDLLRDDLTSMIYHDLRSPLANIISSLDVLNALFSGKENEAVESVLTIARRSTDRIQRLISSLLDLNRLESGQAIVSQQSVTLNMLADEVVDTVRPMTDSRRQTLKINFPQNLQPVWVDVDMIRRVLINLMENASKFSPPEGNIELGARQDKEWVEVWVSDDGPGIPFADQDRIFDKFTRLKGESSPSGLGIGLAFCRLAVQGHGGKVWVDSKPGQGSKFLLTLPNKQK
jgi:signal transduction histidine kinase